MRLKDYPEDDLRQARQLVSSLLKSAEEVEEVISEYSEENVSCERPHIFQPQQHLRCHSLVIDPH